MYAKSPRLGQLACLSVGILVFFDDYANCLLAGKTLRPLLDTLFVSREKLSFIVDATAAPIASISPVSSWVGFEIGLIQDEIDRIIELMGTDDIGIKTEGMAVFLQTIKYRYYPIFMLFLMVALISTQRDFSTMLIAERKTQVYKRTDGGESASEKKSGDGGDFGGDNDPRKDTPHASWNMLIPVAILLFFIFFLLIRSGDDGSGEQTIFEKIESSDSYVALLWGTFATAIVTGMFYMIQIVRDNDFIFPDGSAIWEALTTSKKTIEDSSRARFLMGVGDNIEAFLVGFSRVFPALIVLVLAWACGSVMVHVGADRLFAKWILGGIAPESLPTLSFLISLFMALATGTSWGTMTILFPLLLVPTYIASDGDETIFYAVTAGILSGSVAGDHMSPISDTTVLSSLACDCELLPHVGTQAPYVFVVTLISVVLGTLPIGYVGWPSIIGVLLGLGLIGAFTFFVCKPIVSETGKFDLLTELYMMATKSEELMTLQADTIKAYNGETVEAPEAPAVAEKAAPGEESAAVKVKPGPEFEDASEIYA